MKQMVIGIVGGPYARYEALATVANAFDSVIVNADEAIMSAIDKIGDFNIRRHRLADYEVRGRVTAFFHDQAIFTDEVVRRLSGGARPLVVMGFPLSAEDITVFRHQHREWDLRVLIPPPCPHLITNAERRSEERSRMQRFALWKLGGREEFISMLQAKDIPVEEVYTVGHDTAELVFTRLLGSRYQRSAVSV